MKFLQKEHKDFQLLIEKVGKDPANFHQRKKRGHLYVQEEGREDEFCFFRKKETKLNDQLQWEDQTTYFLDPQNKVQVDSWDEVLLAFESWLKA